ncbi:OLC1v1003033C1 [Oldenlandia corymbosa var. corymbosa]|uniref:Sodium channel modifier 1 n=1 Tax=Oldenlandia corymbosa var. corymbosa TaxID=529605 RepID=A0AAV1D9A5_OLDCO|nr:OLC1v1003033C1 [Oldenlandia corymbosa var. corymbosa]
MSVFGGDSWAREAQYRKRRVDDLIIHGIDGSVYRKLPSGKFLCFICPHRPVLDTPLVLSAHLKGSRHRVAEAKLKERELTRENEIKKRIALADSSLTATSNSGSNASAQRHASVNKPLIKQARQAASQVLASDPPAYATLCKSPDVKLNTSNNRENPSIQPSISTENVNAPQEVLRRQFESRDLRERELKFTSAGWKRDGYGRWFKDENVEFDSDEEDPNICLGLTTTTEPLW